LLNIQTEQTMLPVTAEKARKPSSRERLLAAAAAAFCANGYFSVSVEDIASSAGVSRMTFYRHFSSKAVLAIALFRENVAKSSPRFLAITRHRRLDRIIVQSWISDLFEADRASGQLLRVFIQANVEDSGFTEAAQALLDHLIVELGKHIPAFALDPASPADRKQWLEAWMLIYEILDQSNHAARGSGHSADPLIIEILADRFMRFVESGQTRRIPALIQDNVIADASCE
jgi:AcrR family transcriptional regulator